MLPYELVSSKQDDTVDNLFLNTKYKPTLPSDAELLTVFPKATSVVKKLIKDTKRKIQEINDKNMPAFDAALDRIYAAEMTKEQNEIAVMLAKFWYLELPMHIRVTLVGNKPNIITLQSELQRLERILRLHTLRQTMKDSPDEVNEITIRNAKERRIEEFLSEKPNHAGFIRCPFHSEKTGSFKITGNRFHCFGACGEGGDVIDFIMKTKNVDFLGAVRYLNST